MNSKLPEVGLTIFSEMTNLALKHDAINLSQGFPDFDTHPELKELVAHHIRAGHNQYAPMHGVAALRERIALKTHSLYGAEYDPEAEITVTTGGTEAIYSAVTAVVHPGDEAVIVEPAYDCYAPIVRLSGGRPVYVKLTFPDYRMDWDAFRSRVSARTRLVVLNFPHNPTGAVLNAADLDTLAEILRPTRALVLSDEVYEHIVFDGLRHQGMIGHPELRERSFVVGSFAKTYHTTGWKVGYCLAPRALTTELRKIHQYIVFSVNTPIQHAYADFMGDARRYLELPDFYQRKRDRFIELTRASHFRPLPCHGTYYQMLSYAGISDEPETEFARRLTVDHGVAAIPPSVFYHERDDHKVLRFCFAKKEETLVAAAARLCAI
jgi:methionine aminotransferase